jgi:hypothetical protein
LTGAKLVEGGARKATNVLLVVVASVAIALFVVLPALGLLLLWAWGRFGSE